MRSSTSRTDHRHPRKPCHACCSRTWTLHSVLTQSPQLLLRLQGRKPHPAVRVYSQGYDIGDEEEDEDDFMSGIGRIDTSSSAAGMPLQPGARRFVRTPRTQSGAHYSSPLDRWTCTCFPCSHPVHKIINKHPSHKHPSHTVWCAPFVAFGPLVLQIMCMLTPYTFQCQAPLGRSRHNR